MLGSIPHQKLCFYHLPTQGRAVIKLGDAWYVSNVSIIFSCSMLLYYPFWMFMGFILHIYIIFGTNLLLEAQPILLFFCLFQYFEWKEYQTESKRNEIFGSVIFGTNVIQRTWSASQEAAEVATRQEGAPTPSGRAPLSCGPLGRPPTYFFLLYIPKYPENIQGHHETQFPPP